MSTRPQTSSLPDVTPPARGLPRNEQEFVDQMMYLLRAPMILFPGWENTFRDRQGAMLLRRLAHHQEIFAQGMCTEYEAMLYVSSATLAMPPSHDWAEIFSWLFARWNPKAAQENEIEARELNVNQRDDLARLRRWIFRQQQLHLKEKSKATKRDEMEQEKKRLEAQRPRLF